MSFLSLPGGVQFRELSSDLSAFTIEGLQPDEYVLLSVSAVIDGTVGEAVTLNSRTHGYSISGLRIVDVTSRSIRVTWDTVSSATGYKISWRHNNGTQAG